MTNAMTNLNNTNTLTMSSLEMAELTGKRHDSVKRTIETLVARGVIESPQSVGIKTATKTGVEYRVGKRDSYVIVAQLSPEFTGRVIDRWQEVEEQLVTQSVPTNFVEALRLAADNAERAEALRLENETMKPDAEVGKAVGNRKHLTIMSFIKKLPGVNTMQVRKTLAELGYIYRRAGC
ncbi:MAG: Rha family transcriptional regulator [Halopseudomonas sabulinigri]